MNAREEAEKRLNAIGSGQSWHQVDGIRGVGWALLDLADAIRGGAPTSGDVLHDPPGLCTGCEFCAPVKS